MRAFATLGGLVMAALLSVTVAGCGNAQEALACTEFVNCGGALANTSWTLGIGCGLMETVPTNISFGTSTYTTDSGTSGTYTIDNDVLTLTSGGNSLASSFCVTSDKLLAIQTMGNDAEDYVVYQQTK